MGDKPAGHRGRRRASTRGDFDALGDAPADPARNAGATGVTGVALAGSGKLTRPLVVGINTWAGHAPGIVFNAGLDANAASNYRKRFGFDVKFVLLEDPAAKLAAFRNGDIDVMWNTVDNWAREASILAEQNQKAKSIIMQDWSRGGDGIVSLATIKSIEDLKGKKIACTQFTPSHFLLLYLLSQSGLSAEDRSARREEHHLHAGRAGGRRHVQGEAGGRGRHVGAGPVRRRSPRAATRRTCWCRPTAATNIIADTLCARQDIIDRRPGDAARLRPRAGSKASR